MKPRRRARAVVAGVLVGLAVTGQAISAVAGAVPSGGTQHDDLRYYQAAVNLLPEEDGAYAGGVSFQHVVGGATTVDVFLSRAVTVTCPDLSEDIATTTVQTQSRDASDPGPVLLDIGRSLDQASGHAVVDLVVSDSPGCGESETVTTLPAQEVQIAVTGTTVRFFTGISGTTAAGPDRSTGRFYDFSRDGTGTLSVGSVVVDAESPAAFLKYAVERRRSHGEVPVAPDPVAPAGGLGARGDYSAELQPPGGVGVVYEDAIVHATTTGPPERATTVSASSLTVQLVDCADGSTAFSDVFVVGSGPGSLEVDRRLEAATASGTVELDRFSTDGCLGETAFDTVVLPVSLDLVATAPMVRVSDTRWQVRPGEGSERTHGWYRGREATGTVSVGDVGGTIGLAAIGSSGP